MAVEVRQNPSEKKLNAGIKRVYRIYGPNLSKFFAAVKAEVKAGRAASAAKIDPRFLKSR